jgi:hypothetical protein
MAYHLYVRPDGYPSITEYELDLKVPVFKGYRHLGASEEKPDVEGKKYVNGKWETVRSEPEYVTNRRYGYPPAMELFDALWKAMEKGDLPKVPGFYDRIDALYKRFPKE